MDYHATPVTEFVETHIINTNEYQLGGIPLGVGLVKKATGITFWVAFIGPYPVGPQRRLRSEAIQDAHTARATAAACKAMLPPFPE